jgi:hypothetical protein
MSGSRVPPWARRAYFVGLSCAVVGEPDALVGKPSADLVEPASEVR